MSWAIDVRGTIGRLPYHFALNAGPKPVALIGPNGAGKTTLLRLIAGALQPSEGHLTLNGRDLTALPPEHRKIGYVPQGYGLFPHLTALNNVAFGLPRDHPRAQQLLTELGIAHVAQRRPHALSGGERQRVALARALAIEPHGLLLDEPLAALDVTARRATRGFLIEHLRAAKRPTLVVTHDPRDVRALNGLVVVIEAGQITQIGSVAALSAAPASEFVAEFFG
jgi:ABC-type sulfate/molybdate transport systems ATPase subunit